jgi:hypothetical protein
MLNVSLYRAAPRAHARLFGLAACAWTAWVPAHAAEPPSAEKIFTASFKPYQGWRDEPLQDWRQANQRVGEIGGWRTYLREAQPEGGAGQDAPGHPGHHGH